MQKVTKEESDAVARLESAQLAVARAAGCIVVLENSARFVTIERDGWDELSEALTEWRKASADVLAVARGVR